MEGAEAIRAMEEGVVAGEEGAIRAAMEDVARTFELKGEFTYAIEDGERVMRYNGEPIDFAKVSESLNEGNLIEALENMNVKGRILDSDFMTDFADRYKTAWDESGIGQTLKDTEEFEKSGAQFTEAVGDPQNLEEFKDRVTRNEKVLEQLQNEMKEFKERATEAEQKGEKTVESGSKKSWSRVKLAIELIVIGVTLDWLYNKAKEHQNELNGCWLVFQDGSKCKVQTLTCDSDARNSGQICTQAQMMGCGDGGTDPCFTSKTCVKWKSDGKTCDKYLSSCSSGKCQYCSCSQIPCPKGATLICKNVSFGEALSDFIGKPLDWGAGVLSDIGKWLKRAIIGIIIVIAVIIGIMLLMKLFGRRKETKEKK